MQRNKTKYTIKGVTVVLLLLVGIGAFFVFSSDFFNGSFPWILIALVGGVIVVISLGFMAVFQRRKSSEQYEIDLNEKYKQDEDSIIGREEDDFIPSQKLSSKYGYETQYCEYCGTAREAKSKFCISCGRKYE